jgi:uncharacterized protein YecT (DUF1311 family)
MTELMLRAIAIAILSAACSLNSGDDDVEVGSSYCLKGDYHKAEKKLKEAIGKNWKRQFENKR